MLFGMDSILNFDQLTLSDKKDVRGLPNYGQTCFLNSTLQALASLDSFVVYLDQLSFLQKHQQQSLVWGSSTNNSDIDGIIDILSSTLHAINGDVNNNKSIDALKVLDCVGEKNTQFSSRTPLIFSTSIRASVHEQQDAQELLQALMDLVISSYSDPFKDETNMKDGSIMKNSEFIQQQHRDVQSSSLFQITQQGLSRMAKQQSNPIVTNNNDNSKKPHTNEIQNNNIKTNNNNNIQHIVEEKKDEEGEESFHRPYKPEDNYNYNCNHKSDNYQNNDTSSLLPPSATVTANPQQQNIVSGCLILGGEEDNSTTAIADPISEKSDSNNNVTHKSDDHQKNDTSLLLPLSATATVPPKNTENSQQENDVLGCLILEGEEDDSAAVPINKAQSDSIKNSMMLDSISPITPSPLNGWIGSTLKCVLCHHVRPIQNSPFLDVPLVPTSIHDQHLSSTYNILRTESMPCSLEVCLQNYTSTERVTDVECRNCTKLQRLGHWKEELNMLKSATKSVTKSGKSPSTALQHDLQTAMLQYDHWLQTDPDEDQDWNNNDNKSNDNNIYDKGVSLLRCDAW
eukprot:CAMPEP_0194154030 /NCGR_PEP_ID=MMETSP0152-20130528/58896_1 /TAXON_ID=1049557 /ORGANISM="Thalassiothrix antarctica, Strain L6-D1" /LENGTH=569 /DNA_ID=CAMNT_0038859793 /DNA_START=1 /DNA_END=1707 /DNA_ORIENTATION=+